MNVVAKSLSKSSPRAWRSTEDAGNSFDHFQVFSTCVEVNLTMTGESEFPARLLHVRGGQPLVDDGLEVVVMSSPRAWRSTVRASPAELGNHVFSTCVEVNPQHTRKSTRSPCLLHVRGGQPGVRPRRRG